MCRGGICANPNRWDNFTSSHYFSFCFVHSCLRGCLTNYKFYMRDPDNLIDWIFVSVASRENVSFPRVFVVDNFLKFKALVEANFICRNTAIAENIQSACKYNDYYVNQCERSWILCTCDIKYVFRHGFHVCRPWIFKHNFRNWLRICTRATQRSFDWHGLAPESIDNSPSEDAQTVTKKILTLEKYAHGASGISSCKLCRSFGWIFSSAQQNDRLEVFPFPLEIYCSNLS